jgi:alkylresorcinol/alkylpyrone synthase
MQVSTGNSRHADVQPVSVLSIATGVPPHVLEQRDVAVATRAMFPRLFQRYPALTDIFVNAGIERRQSVRPMAWFDEPHDWPQRTQAFLEGAEALYLDVARDALGKAGLNARDIDIVVTVCSTGIATPSLEARVASRLSLRSDVSRVPVFGLGCAGGVSGLSIGARLARGSPGARVLVVVIELCTLAFRHDRNSKADVISTALFGDGAAAVVLHTPARDEANAAAEGAFTIHAGHEHTWPDTLDIMGWSVDPIGLGVVLSRSLPRFVEERFGEPVRAFMHAQHLPPDCRFICHPGGAKVLTAVEAALGVSPETLADERTVLREHGNMSAPTALFVLAHALETGWRGPAVLCALGPGFTATFLHLESDRG